MARIAGVDLPRDKRVEIGLTYIYGIGRTSATSILTEAGVNPDIRCRDPVSYTHLLRTVDGTVDIDDVFRAITEFLGA